MGVIGVSVGGIGGIDIGESWWLWCACVVLVSVGGIGDCR